jgi:hypothetical protein
MAAIEIADFIWYKNGKNASQEFVVVALSIKEPAEFCDVINLYDKQKNFLMIPDNENCDSVSDSDLSPIRKLFNVIFMCNGQNNQKGGKKF